MYCYKDQTFCESTNCTKTSCFRHISHLIHNIEELPVCMSTFDQCEDRTSPVKLEDCEVD